MRYAKSLVAQIKMPDCGPVEAPPDQARRAPPSVEGSDAGRKASLGKRHPRVHDEERRASGARMRVSDSARRRPRVSGPGLRSDARRLRGRVGIERRIGIHIERGLGVERRRNGVHIEWGLGVEWQRHRMRRLRVRPRDSGVLRAAQWAWRRWNARRRSNLRVHGKGPMPERCGPFVHELRELLERRGVLLHVWRGRGAWWPAWRRGRFSFRRLPAIVCPGRLSAL